MLVEEEELKVTVIVEQVPEATGLTVIVDKVPVEEEELKVTVIVYQVPVEEEEATGLTVIVDRVLVEEEEDTEL